MLLPLILTLIFVGVALLVVLVLAAAVGLITQIRERLAKAGRGGSKGRSKGRSRWWCRLRRFL